MLGATAQGAIENMLGEGQAVLFGVVVKQAEQSRQRQALGVESVPVGELFGGRVHVDDAAVDIGRNDPIANGGQSDLRTVLFHLQGTGEGLALGQ